MDSKQIQETVVLFSGGWESTLCLLKAKRPAQAILFLYGQPYASQEIDAARRICKSLDVPLLIVTCQTFGISGKVFNGRNEEFIRTAAERGAKVIWFGCRNPFSLFDAYGDSNKQFASRVGKKYGVTIRTPAVLWPKWLVKWYVQNKDISSADIFSSEGWKCE